MKSLKTMLTSLRESLGWAPLSETRLSPDHGWLLKEHAPPPPAAKVPPPISKMD